MNNDELRAELAMLIMRRAGGDMTDEELLWLETLLLNDPVARRLYVQYINDTLSLQELLAGVGEPSAQAGGVSPPLIPAQKQGAHAPRSPRMRSPKTRSPGKRRRWLAAAALAASLLIAAVFAGRWLLSESEPVAQLTRTANAQWADSAPGRGEVILSGRTLQLTAGFAEIKFHSGARVVLEGPASLTLESANAGRLATGKLVARVPKQAHGFTIHTAAETIVDRGTEFGVWVRA
ncbi:MAG: FecR family protein, partial [Planctomycetes bacterium]|nr:FecR family protein [Planctomycetota bacterium]